MCSPSSSSAGRPGSSRWQPRAAAPAATEVLDPVCGMTVTADDAHFPVEHAGTTYWFCRVACSQAFAADPAQYLSEAEA